MCRSFCTPDPLDDNRCPHLRAVVSCLKHAGGRPCDRLVEALLTAFRQRAMCTACLTWVRCVALKVQEHIDNEAMDGARTSDDLVRETPLKGRKRTLRLDEDFRKHAHLDCVKTRKAQSGSQVFKILGVSKRVAWEAERLYLVEYVAVAKRTFMNDHFFSWCSDASKFGNPSVDHMRYQLWGAESNSGVYLPSQDSASSYCVLDCRV